MSTLGSAMDEFTALDLGGLGDEELSDHLTEVERASRVLESQRARVIAEIEERRSYVSDGFVSTESWLSHRLGVASSAAAQQVRLARAIGHMPRTRAALSEGAIGLSSAALLVSARETDPATFERTEEVLVGLARELSPRDLRRAIDRWRQLADAEAADRAAERRFQRRGLFVSATLDGMVRLDGDLDPETGQTILTALRSMVDAAARGAEPDERRPAQRRADALGEICRRTWIRPSGR